MGSLRLVLSTSITSVAICAAFGRASAIAYDSAGDSAYNDVYNVSDGSGASSLEGLNGGYGWGTAWQTAYGPVYVGSSSTNGTGDPYGTGNVNSPRTPLGRAWGMKAPNLAEPYPTIALRAFAGALSAGQTFTIDVDTGSLASAAPTEFMAVAFGAPPPHVWEWSPEGAFGVVAEKGYGSDYMVWQGAAVTDSGIAVTDQGIHIEVAVLDDSHASISIRSLATGQAASTPIAYTPVDNFAVYNNVEALTPLRQYAYFNNIAITPEPGSSGLIAVIVALLLLRRRAPVF